MSGRDELTAAQALAQEQQIRRHAEADAAQSHNEARSLKARLTALERLYDAIVTSHDVLAVRLASFEEGARPEGATAFGGTGEAPSPPPHRGPPVAVAFPVCKACGAMDGHGVDCPLGGRGTRGGEEIAFSFDGMFAHDVTVESQSPESSICEVCGVAGGHRADCPAHQRVGEPSHSEEAQSEAQQRKGSGLDAERPVGTDSVHGGAERGPSADALRVRLKALVNVASESTDGDVRAEVGRLARVLGGAANLDALDEQIGLLSAQRASYERAICAENNLKEATKLLDCYLDITHKVWQRLGDILPLGAHAQLCHERLASLLDVLCEYYEGGPATWEPRDSMYVVRRPQKQPGILRRAKLVPYGTSGDSWEGDWLLGYPEYPPRGSHPAGRLEYSSFSTEQLLRAYMPATPISKVEQQRAEKDKGEP